MRSCACIETFWNEFFSTFEENQLETHGFTEARYGRIARPRMFQERAEALEAAGLRK